IKPTNILIAATGQAKLVDFGLAEITSAAGSVHLMRQTDRDEDVAVDRTVDYAGLEKATGMKPGDVRSDIYFLGTVLFEMVTGEALMPVTKDRQVRMMAKRYHDVEDTLARRGPEYGLPKPLQKLIAKMVAFDPRERFQNPAELLEAVTHCRADLGGHAALEVQSRVAAGPRTLFVVEGNDKLREAIRDKFKANGFRVLLSIDPNQAVRRFKEQPFHALIVDARTVGEDGVEAFNRVLREADTNAVDIGAVLILGADQRVWANRAVSRPNGAILHDPVTMKQLIETLVALAPAADEPAAAPAGGG
ncbi:MAG: protein kinase, partial [Gemmataceae bacterium]|nr:protein kinase [Gemmataceae bacterium]